MRTPEMVAPSQRASVEGACQGLLRATSGTKHAPIATASPALAFRVLAAVSAPALMAAAYAFVLLLGVLMLVAGCQ